MFNSEKDFHNLWDIFHPRYRSENFSHTKVGVNVFQNHEMMTILIRGLNAYLIKQQFKRDLHHTCNRRQFENS